MYIVSKNDAVGIVNLGTQNHIYIGRDAIRVDPLGDSIYTGGDIAKRFKDLKEALGAGVQCYDFSKKVGDWKKEDHQEPEPKPKSQTSK